MGRPQRLDAALTSTRPLEAEIRVEGYAMRSTFGWSVPIDVERWRQGSEIGVFARDATLSLPDSVAPPARGERFRAWAICDQGPTSPTSRRFHSAAGGWR